MAAPQNSSAAAASPLAPAAKTGARWNWALLLTALVGLLVAAKYLHAERGLRAALEWVGQLGPWGALLFMGIYIVATVLFIPGSVLTLGAGALFGVVRGSLLVSIASLLGASGAFLIGRYLARDAIARKISAHAKFAAIDQAVAAEGWKIVLLTRLSPVFPFTLLNYAFGLTRVPFSHYVLASWIGMMPGTVMYVYLGSLAQASAGPRSRTPAEWTLYAVGLVATVAVTVMVTRLARRALARKISPANSPTAGTHSKAFLS